MSIKNNHALKIALIGASSVMLGLLPLGLSSLNANALEVNYQTQGNSFKQAPRLVRVAASRLNTNAPATYQFTIEIPAGAEQPMQAVAIHQEPNVEEIKFDLNQSEAFVGDSFAGGPLVELSSIGGEASDQVVIVFDEPVQPGSTITVSLQAKQNPHYGGAYQFRVIAFPIGENSNGLDLGSRSIIFNSGD